MSVELAKQKCRQADDLLVAARQASSDHEMIRQAVGLYQEVLRMNEVHIADPYLGTAYLAFSAGDAEKALSLLLTAQQVEPANRKTALMQQRIERAISNGSVPPLRPMPQQAEEPTATAPAETAVPWEEESAVPAQTLKLTDDLGPPQRPGKVSEGDQVLLLQMVLNKLGFKLPITGHFDQPTFSAVRAFQARKSLPITGMVDGKTRAFLNHVLSKMPPEVIEKLVQNPLSEEGTLEDDAEVPESFTSDLGLPEQPQKTSSGLEVLLLQELLTKLGHAAEISGEYDKATMTAVRAVQSSHKIPVSGSVDAKTRQVLNHLLQITFRENTTMVQLTQQVWQFRVKRQWPVKNLFSVYLNELFQQLFTLLKQPLAATDTLWVVPPPGQRILLHALLGTPGQQGVVSEGDEVYVLQQFLVNQGFELAINKKFDMQTFSQLKAWQQAHGLPPTGQTEAATRQPINAILQERYEGEQAFDDLRDEVLDFQNSLKLPMGAHTYEKIAPLLHEVLFFTTLPEITGELGPSNRPGKISQGYEVRVVQELLSLSGYSVSSPPGIYDNGMYNVVRSFQQANQLPMTGFIDEKSRQVLNPLLQEWVEQNQIEMDPIESFGE